MDGIDMSLSFLETMFTRKKRVYLDNGGATPISARAKRALLETFHIYGNPSSIYKEGVEASKLLETARKKIASIINARQHEIYFTGSGTESCNLAIFGIYYAWKKENEYVKTLPHIIISSIEHPAVMEAVHYLVINSLANITYLPVYKDGIVKVQDVKNAITKETILVSIMYANNEIGTIQPIKEIGRMLEEHKKARRLKLDVGSNEDSRSESSASNYPLFHTDACQAGNYLNLDVFRLKVDMMTLNSSKVYGPKGIALLYKKEGVPISPVTFGGGQERGLRSGTEDVASICAFAEALAEAQELRESESTRLQSLRDSFKEKLQKQLPQVVFYGSFDKRLANNINCRVPGISSEEMILRLDAKGFAVSHKSACASQVDDSSYVVKALGATDTEAKENIRITLGRSTTQEDLERLVDEIEKIVKKYSN